jgi:hypothetical protein
LPWRSEPDIQTAEECLKRTDRLPSSMNFNHSLCERFVSSYLHRARESLEERESEIEA